MSTQSAPSEHPGADRPRPKGWLRRLWLLLLLSTLILTAADQLTKRWAHAELRQSHGGSLSVARSEKLAFSFTYVRNHGAAWGFLSDADESFRGPFFFLISLAAMGFILYLFARLRPGQRLLASALALVLAGALGNFIDRIRFGYVIDFIDLRYSTFRWPTFNVADIAISIGVALLVVESILGGRRRPDDREADQEVG